MRGVPRDRRAISAAPPVGPSPSTSTPRMAAARSTMASSARRAQHDLEVLLQARLADEVGQPARPQRRLFGTLGGVGRRLEQLLAHRAA